MHANVKIVFEKCSTSSKLLVSIIFNMLQSRVTKSLLLHDYMELINVKMGILGVGRKREELEKLAGSSKR